MTGPIVDHISHYSFYKSVYNRRDKSELRTLAHLKRFLERYTGDPNFRAAIESGIYDLDDAARESGCAVDVHSLTPIFDTKFSQYRAPDQIAAWPMALLWDTYIRDLVGFRDKIKALNTGGHNLAYDGWRDRQKHRTALDLGVSARGLVHAPVAFEISSGCSVGCWFCGVSAEKFRGHFTLSDGGDTIWTQTLSEVRSVLGEAMTGGFLYWATDPLDNPEYPHFLDIYHDITGVFPQTTTAIPNKNPALTRDVMSRWGADPCFPNRFSVLNTKILREIHQEFTPEEMLGVELVLQNFGSISGSKTKAGKTYTASKTAGSNIGNLSKFRINNGTIACVSGFLINILERTVRLVSPCTPTDKWPDGFIVFDQASYETPSELGDLLHMMTNRHMRDKIFSADILEFSENFEYCELDGKRVVRAGCSKIESSAIDLFAPYISADRLTNFDLLQKAIADGKNPITVVHAIDRSREAGIVDYVR